MPCWIQAFKSPQIYLLKTIILAELQCVVKQLTADTLIMIMFIHDKPSKMSSFVLCFQAIDGYRSEDISVSKGEPKSIMLIVISQKKIRQISCNFCLKKQTKIPIFRIITSVGFNNPSYNPRDVSFIYMHIKHKSTLQHSKRRIEETGYSSYTVKYPYLTNLVAALP